MIALVITVGSSLARGGGHHSRQTEMVSCDIPEQASPSGLVELILRDLLIRRLIRGQVKRTSEEPEFAPLSLDFLGCDMAVNVGCKNDSGGLGM